MLESLPPWAKGLTIVFTCSSKLGEAEGLHWIQKWQLMDLPDQLLPPACLDDDSPARWEIPNLVDTKSVREWRLRSGRKMKEQVVEDLQNSIDAVEEERELIEKKLQAIDWLEEACVQSGFHWQDLVEHGFRKADRYADTLDQYGAASNRPDQWEQAVEEMRQRDLKTSPERILHTELGRAVQAKKHIQILQEVLREIPLVRELLQLRYEIYRKAAARVKAGGTVETIKPKEPPYSPEVNEYLKLAYYWYEGGNRCEGNKPTELWKYLAEQTGNKAQAPRKAFKRKGWYEPWALAPGECTRKRVLEKGSKYFL